MNRRALLKSATLVAAGTGTRAGSERVRAAETSETAPSRAASVNELVVRYIATRNERIAERGRDLVARTWAEDGTYIDRVRRGVGHDGLDSMIQTAQEQYPGYRLRLTGSITAHNGYMRLSWAAGGTPEAPLYIAGADFAVVGSDGRFKSVTGFVDAAPAPIA
jgi:hypothetical protein